MDFHFGVDVRPREGSKLGELRRIIFDVETHEALSLVVQHAGFEGRELIVPIGAVDDADADGVYVELSDEQFDQMPDFGVEDRNLAPPPTADNLTGDEVKDPVEVPDVPSVGAATGVESIAYTPIVQETVDVPPSEQVVDAHTTIWATDGDVGTVENVFVDDETRRIVGFAAEKGFIFKHDVDVPMEWVSDVRPDAIVLSVERARLEAGSDD